jgi:hypothetical protein
VFLCSVENHHKYMCDYYIIFSAKSLAKLCLRAPNVFSNVLPPNICQCPPCELLVMGSPGLGHGLLLAVAETMHSILSSGDHNFAVLSILSSKDTVCTMN